MGTEHDSENLQRFSFTIPKSLIDSIDHIIEDTGSNRSMVVREALHHWVDHQVKSTEVDAIGVATVSYIYDHHDTTTLSQIMETQHSFDDIIQTTSHVHLSHSECFEINICKGNLIKVKKFGDIVRSIKGIQSFYTNYARSEKIEEREE